MKVALVQINSGSDKATNIRKALDFCSEALAKKAGFVLLPEYVDFRGEIDPLALCRTIAEPINGPTVKAFSLLAQKKRAYILLGSIHERSIRGGRAHNTSVLLDSRGKVAATYRKQNLFCMKLGRNNICEAKRFYPGRRMTTARIGLFRAGLTVCFDVRFPAIFEAYARRGANLFTVPAAFSRTTGKAHWEILLRARATETFSYVLAPNQTGTGGGGVPSWGNSMVVSPWGEVLAKASENKEELVWADIDRQEVSRVRAMFPGFKKLRR